MNLRDYELLKRLKDRPPMVINKNILMPFLANRTLLYGYTCERKTWHVYMKDTTIHKVIYGYDEDPIEYEVRDNYDFIPDKRLYPETCDYQFCKILQRFGHDLPFTSWNEDREEQQYYGKII